MALFKLGRAASESETIEARTMEACKRAREFQVIIVYIIRQ